MPVRRARRSSGSSTPAGSTWGASITRRRAPPPRLGASTRTSSAWRQTLNLPSAQQCAEAGRVFSVDALVPLLLRPRSPSAVRRFVIPVVVDAVNRVVGRRSTAHVGQERFVCVPASADGDATVGVVAPLVEVRLAPLVNRRPRLKLRGPVPTPRLAVRGQNLAHAVALQTPTAPSVAGPKAPTSDRRLFPAVAAAQPAPPGRWVMWCASNDRQAPESIALV